MGQARSTRGRDARVVYTCKRRGTGGSGASVSVFGGGQGVVVTSSTRGLNGGRGKEAWEEALGANHLVAPQ